MREILPEPIPIVRSISAERRQEIVDPVVASVTLWGRQLRSLFTHCVGDRGRPAKRQQQGQVTSVGDGRETGQTRVCITLDDGRSVVVGLEGEHALQDGQSVTVDWA